MSTKRHSVRNFKNTNNRYNSANVAAIIGGRSPFSISYLAVAGGGAGGSSPFLPPNFTAGGGGGGGAGGYLEGVITAQADTIYTIMIGAGGTGAVPAINTTQGSNSNISIGATSIAQALGGGFGLSYISFPGYTAGASGGSGGGGQAVPAPQGLRAGSGFGYPSPTQQGYPGGEANPTSNPGLGAESQGGGGGAGGIGTAGSGPPAVSQGGPGGIGRQWTHTGTTYYAGGGGGTSGYLSPGTGGLGGGGDGGYGNPPYQGTAGRTNSGGGGGGMGYTGSPQISGKNGGSGVVFLCIPTPAYRGVPSYTGSNVMVSTPPSSPGNTVIAFYTSGTFTA